MGYLGINNLYKDMDILLFRECYAMEKLHGSSAHLSWQNNKLSFFAGGAKHQSFVSLFDEAALTQIFTDTFGQDSVTVYGEAYAGKMQGMSATYGKELKFIAFEVRVEDSWLSVPKAEEVVKKLGLEFVHYVKIPTDMVAIDAERDADSVQAVRNGMGAGKMREGVVLRPLIEVVKNNGERIIVKHKREEFSERKHVPKTEDAAKLEVLTAAQAIAEEWVVPMRLEHILQELPNVSGVEHTGEVCKAMIADVYKEAKGEIVESKEVASAIGRVAAGLWKKHLKRNISEKV